MGEKLWTREFIGMGLTNFFYFMSQYIMNVPIHHDCGAAGLHHG